ncbi:hypothetical protein Sjap_023582 [Stephania japonica]|uniref:Uncharacterized protein n=1 Tax=Stephania japonica TaxID=461633 RepID=A0AAP0HPC7_9MAGN
MNSNYCSFRHRLCENDEQLASATSTIEITKAVAKFGRPLMASGEAAEAINGFRRGQKWALVAGGRRTRREVGGVVGSENLPFETHRNLVGDVSEPRRKSLTRGLRSKVVGRVGVKWIRLMSLKEACGASDCYSRPQEKQIREDYTISDHGLLTKDIRKQTRLIRRPSFNQAMLQPVEESLPLLWVIFVDYRVQALTKLRFGTHDDDDDGDDDGGEEETVWRGRGDGMEMLQRMQRRCCSSECRGRGDGIDGGLEKFSFGRTESETDLLGKNPETELETEI